MYIPPSAVLYRTGCHQLKVLHTLQAQPASRQSECSIASAAGSASLDSRKENAGWRSAVRSNTFPLYLSKPLHEEGKENLPQRAPAPYGRFFLYKISVTAICCGASWFWEKAACAYRRFHSFQKARYPLRSKLLFGNFFG